MPPNADVRRHAPGLLRRLRDPGDREQPGPAALHRLPDPVSRAVRDARAPGPAELRDPARDRSRRRHSDGPPGLSRAAGARARALRGGPGVARGPALPARVAVPGAEPSDRGVRDRRRSPRGGRQSRRRRAAHPARGQGRRHELAALVLLLGAGDCGPGHDAAAGADRSGRLARGAAALGGRAGGERRVPAPRAAAAHRA